MLRFHAVRTRTNPKDSRPRVIHIHQTLYPRTTAPISSTRTPAHPRQKTQTHQAMSKFPALQKKKKKPRHSAAEKNWFEAAAGTQGPASSRVSCSRGHKTRARINPSTMPHIHIKSPTPSAPKYSRPVILITPHPNSQTPTLNPPQ